MRYLQLDRNTWWLREGAWTLRDSFSWRVDQISRVACSIASRPTHLLIEIDFGLRFWLAVVVDRIDFIGDVLRFVESGNILNSLWQLVSANDYVSVLEQLENSLISHRVLSVFAHDSSFQSMTAQGDLKSQSCETRQLSFCTTYVSQRDLWARRRWGGGTMR